MSKSQEATEGGKNEEKAKQREARRNSGDTRRPLEEAGAVRQGPGLGPDSLAAEDESLRTAQWPTAACASVVGSDSENNSFSRRTQVHGMM